jgi:hypothetical protein
MIINRN